MTPTNQLDTRTDISKSPCPDDSRNFNMSFGVIGQAPSNRSNGQLPTVIGSSRLLSNPTNYPRVDEFNVYQKQLQFEQQQQYAHQLQLQELLRQQHQQQQQQQHQQQLHMHMKQQDLVSESMRSHRSTPPPQLFYPPSASIDRPSSPRQALLSSASSTPSPSQKRFIEYSYGVLHYGAVSQPGESTAAAAWWIADQAENIIVQGSIALQQAAPAPIRVEYEALQHGVTAALEHKITHLSIKGTSDLIKEQFSSGKVFPYFRTVYYSVRDIIPLVQNTLTQFVSVSFEVISVDKNFYVKTLAEDAISIHKRRQELAVFSLINETEEKARPPTPSVSMFKPIAAPIHHQLIHTSTVYSSNPTTHDSAYDNCDLATSLWMSSESVSPNESYYSRHSSPGLPMSTYPTSFVNKISSSSAKGFESDLNQGNVMTFRIIN